MDKASHSFDIRHGYCLSNHPVVKWSMAKIIHLLLLRDFGIRPMKSMPHRVNGWDTGLRGVTGACSACPFPATWHSEHRASTTRTVRSIAGHQ